MVVMAPTPPGGAPVTSRPLNPPQVVRVSETGKMLLIDAANVVGSRPTGWWRDRPAAARAFVERVRAAAQADRFAGPVVVVLEGAACSGVGEGVADGVRVLHAPRSGDDMLIAVAAE